MITNFQYKPELDELKRYVETYDYRVFRGTRYNNFHSFTEMNYKTTEGNCVCIRINELIYDYHVIEEVILRYINENKEKG